MRPALVAAVLVFVLVCVLACVLLAERRAGAPARAGALGGARLRAGPAPSPNLVVDTLNLTHWLRGGAEPLTPAAIVGAIDATAPALKRRYTGRLMYVLKDRESQFDDDSARDLYRQAAERNGVYVSVASRYADPPAESERPAAPEHSSKGRDDFYMSILAARYRCAVLTADKLRDFERFRATVPPFRVVEFAYWRRLPAQDYVRPSSTAYAKMRKPVTIHPSAYFSHGP